MTRTPPHVALDIGDRDRLPSRFFGASHGVRAQG